MANEEHLARFREGVKRWNKWRRENPDIHPDLSGVNLSRRSEFINSVTSIAGSIFVSNYLIINTFTTKNVFNNVIIGVFGSLVGASFGYFIGRMIAKVFNKNLTEINFSNTNLQNANLTNINLTKANFKNANLLKTDLSNTNLRQAVFIGATIVKTCFNDANLCRANFRKANIEKSSFIGANLSKVDFRKANIQTVDFISSILVEANLNQLNIKNTTFRYSNLSKVNLSQSDMSEIEFEQSNFSYANLQGSNFTKSNFRGAKFKKANLSGANFNEAILGCVGYFLSYDSFGEPSNNVSFEEADISGANLSCTDLSAANFQKAILNHINLRKSKIDKFTNLGRKWQLIWTLQNHGAESKNLENADLSYADLHGVNFTEANLKAVKALDTNFFNATLTGACIEDWSINARTNFENIKCDYVFMKAVYKDGEVVYEDRRPSNPDTFFQARDFEKLVQQAVTTVDLIFSEGINWRAFLASFQSLQSETGEELSIRAIEASTNNSYIIKLDVSADANKAQIEKEVYARYELELKYLQGRVYEMNRQLEAQRSLMLDIVKTMAEKETTKEEYNFYNQNAQVGNQAGKLQDSARQNSTLHNYAPEQKQDIVEAAAEIQKLLDQLSQTYPTTTVYEKSILATKAVDEIEKKPEVKEKLVKALKAGSAAALIELIDNPVVNILTPMLEALLE